MEYSYFNGTWCSRKRERPQSQFKCVKKKKKSWWWHWGDTKICLKTLPYQLYQHCRYHLQNVTTDPENKRDCLCRASTHHPSSIFLCQGRKDEQAFFILMVNKGPTSRSPRSHRPSQEGQPFAKTWAAWVTAAFYQQRENWRVKMRCQQDEAWPEVKAENHTQNLPYRGPSSIPGPRVCEDFGEEARDVRACVLHMHTNPSLHLHLTGRWRAARRARCTDQWLRSTRTGSYEHTLRPILHD